MMYYGQEPKTYTEYSVVSDTSEERFATRLTFMSKDGWKVVSMHYTSRIEKSTAAMHVAYLEREVTKGK